MKNGAIKFGILILVMSLSAWVVAQEAAPAEGDAKPQAGSEEVLQEMLGGVQKSPVIEPTQQPVNGQSSATVLTDVRLLGVAPALKDQPLRPEGELIISRRGRIMEATGAELPLFVFDADAASTPEAPMFLMPCQMTQDMQRMVRQGGESVAFILTGQVFTYHGGNYVLPTMMKVAVDKGNLQ